MGIDNMTSRPRWMANDGSEQKERLPVALQDGYIGADEMSLADLVRLSAEFAKRLEFVSTHDAGTEQWDRWFRLDEALVLADIAVADIEGWRAAFLLQVDLASLDQRAEKDLQEHASRLDQRIVDWRQALSMFGQTGKNGVQADQAPAKPPACRKRLAQPIDRAPRRVLFDPR